MTERSVKEKSAMPKIVDKAEKRGRILETAIKVFAERGVNNTKIADIAQAAGIGKGTVYEYFGSKDEIITATFRYFMNTVGEHIGRRWDDLQDPLQRLEAFFKAWGEVLEGEFQDYLEVILDFWAESIRQEKSSQAFDLSELYAEYRTTLESVLEEAIQVGEIQPVDTTITAAVLLGAMDGLLLQWIVDRSVFDIRAAVELLPKLVLEGIKVNG
jgi:TetR/AcrR family fatty acid metabolism transcriptional regulator